MVLAIVHTNMHLGRIWKVCAVHTYSCSTCAMEQASLQRKHTFMKCVMQHSATHIPVILRNHVYLRKHVLTCLIMQPCIFRRSCHFRRSCILMPSGIFMWSSTFMRSSIFMQSSLSYATKHPCAIKHPCATMKKLCIPKRSCHFYAITRFYVINNKTWFFFFYTNMSKHPFCIPMIMYLYANMWTGKNSNIQQPCAPATVRFSICVF